MSVRIFAIYKGEQVHTQHIRFEERKKKRKKKAKKNKHFDKKNATHPTSAGTMLNETYESMFSGSSATMASAAFFCLVDTENVPGGSLMSLVVVLVVAVTLMTPS